jgi:NAD(P)-dependent dehydrogenase (short-subunit alcohol dehydrogenase family)
MIIAGKTILVTGANRGIGQALAEEALTRGAERVYAGTRVPLTHADARVTPLTLIFPGLMPQSLAEGWRHGAAKTLERELAALAQSISNARD